MSPTTKGRLAVLISSAMGCLIPVCNRGLKEAGWNAFQMSGMRGVTGAVVTWILFLLLEGRHPRTPSRIQWPSVLAYCLTFLVGVVSFNYSLYHLPMWCAISIVYCSAVWVYLWESLTSKTLPTRRECVVIVGAVIGILLMLLGGRTNRAIEPIGVLAAGVGSCALALISLTGKQSRLAGVETGDLSFYCLVGMSSLAPLAITATWSTHAIGWMSLNGLVCGALYSWILCHGVQNCPPKEASVLQYVEVPVIWLMGVVIYHEPINGLNLLGAIFVLGSLLGLSVTTNKI